MQEIQIANSKYYKIIEIALTCSLPVDIPAQPVTGKRWSEGTIYETRQEAEDDFMTSEDPFQFWDSITGRNLVYKEHVRKKD